MSKPIVSVHVPKTAGTFLRKQLELVYGNYLKSDYEHPPSMVHQPCGFDTANFLSLLDAEVGDYKFVHGHFHPLKYAQYDVPFTTILRDPVERMISNYLFFCDFKKYQEQGMGIEPIAEYLLNWDLSVVDFAKIPTMKYFYSKTYFGGFNMNRFDLIGDFNEMETYLVELGDLAGKNFVSLYKPKPDQVYSHKQRALLNNDDLMRRLRGILKEDVEFYEKWTRS